jgi:hypothetical protein
MKLYTEKQVKSFLKERTFIRKETIDAMCKSLTPIELPSDEEIRKRGWEDADAEDDIAFFVGAKWVKEQILKQNKS